MQLSSGSTRSSLRTLLTLVALAALGLPSRAIGPPTLVADLDVDTGRRSSRPQQFHRVGDRVVFAASDPLHGLELRSIGRDAVGEVELLVDANPGTADSSSRFLASLGSALLYATGRPGESTLWITDGSAAGTRVVRDETGAAIVIDSYHAPRTATFGERLAIPGISATTRESGVWALSANGSAARLRGSASGYFSHFFGLAATDERFFFLEGAVGSSAVSLWTSDGTSDGTRLVLDALTSVNSATTSTAERYFFVAWRDGQDFLFVSDGSAQGTLPLLAFGPYPDVPPARFEAGATRIYFAATLGGTTSLWVSDGTVAGTFPVPDVVSPASGYDNGLLGAWVGDRFVFAAYGSGESAYWAHDGSRRPPVLLPTTVALSSAEGDLVVFGAEALFAAPSPGGSGDEIWRTDGTPAGTYQVSRLCPPDCFYFAIDPDARVGGLLLFEILDDCSMFGCDFYTAVSDGTAAGTKILNDGNEEVAVEVGPTTDAARVDGGFLVPGDERFGSGKELWHLGAGDGALRHVANLEPELGASRPQRLEAAGDRLFWVDEERRATARTWSLGAPELAPVQLTSDVCQHGALVPAARLGVNELFLGAESPDEFRCLAALDLESGDWTKLYPPGLFDLGSVPEPLVEVAGRVYFGSGGSGILAGLWTTDGTVAGTARLEVDGLPGDLTLLSATATHLFLRARYGPIALFSVALANGTAEQIASFSLPATFGSGTESVSAETRYYFTSFEPGARERLRVSDGSAAGTLELWSSVADEARVLDLFPWGDSVFFLVGSDRMTLWASDGTVAGTFAVADLGALAADADDDLPRGSLVFDGRLYFAAESDALGAELWATDGTAEGTVAFDLLPGPGSSAPRWLAAAGGTLFFVADDPVFGREVWASDGTPAGTRRVTDIAAGAASAAPEELVAAGSTLYFAADDGFRGRELWSLDAGATERCVPGARRLCLRDGRFAVEGAWRDFAGHAGAAAAIPRGEASGAFWFFDPTNVEAVVKILDGGPVNDRFWLYYAALSNVAYDLQVTDTAAHVTKRYSNPEGRFASVGDVDAFESVSANPGVSTTTSQPQPSPGTASTSPGMSFAPSTVSEASTGLCAPEPTRLCLQQGRFAVEARWRDFLGSQGVAHAVPWTPDTGLLWFFDPEIPELAVKVLDGGALNGRFWVLSGALSNVEYTLTVTDLLTGAVREYYNPRGTYAAFGDIDAF